MANVRHLLDTLEDPFELFPLQSVSAQLAELVNQAGLRHFERNGLYGPSRKFYSVEDEQDVAVEILLIGSSFVMAQAAITRAISIATKIRDLLEEPSWLTHGKESLMSTEAPVQDEIGMSKIALVDAVANYFKHHYEWPDNWADAGGAQKTIDAVVRLGFEPGSENNLSRALQALGMTDRDLSPLGTLIQEWRERLAAHLREQINRHRT